MPRPKVPTTRSFSRLWIARSRTAMVGRPPLSCDPLLAAVDGDEEAELGADEEQVRVDVVLGDRVAPCRAPAGRRRSTSRSGRASVLLQQVRLEVARSCGCRRRRRRCPASCCEATRRAHVGALRHAGERLDLPPARAAVLGDLDQAVVGADVEQPLLLRRLGQRRRCCRRTRSRRSWRPRPAPQTLPITGSLLRSSCRVRSPADRPSTSRRGRRCGRAVARRSRAASARAG